MTATLVIGVPSKGRLQENTNAFFAAAGMPVRQTGGARGYTGTIAGLGNIEIAFLSAADIARKLSDGAIHLGVTGEDLLRESIPDTDKAVEFIAPLGFGYANVVVAVPQSWIDVSTMADLDDVAAAFYARSRARMRVATKYVNLTRSFFAAHGIADYRIVESPGATEGAPGGGSAELIVDITTTGATLAANSLKILDDGVMLRSEANLVASCAADWSPPVRAALAEVLSRVAARQRGRIIHEVRFLAPEGGAAALEKILGEFSAEAPFGIRPGAVASIHCPSASLYDLIAALKGAGAGTISVAGLEMVFEADNALYGKLVSRFGWR
ncbi:MAG: ATP phosphoribosyltransferase [Rhodobiaceae bacterium]|nr:ATP phosphoribosyltransferase [Rhodobiaceae bacterium]